LTSERGFDSEGARRAIALFLESLGYDPDEPQLRDTPQRVAEAFASELLRGRTVDVRELLLGGSEVTTASAGLVLVRSIAVVTVCPHHMLPGLGTATVAYLPGERLVGLGTIARLVDACARRLTLQENIGEDVAGALMDHAGARGAYCRLELLHTCMATRGAEQPEARLVTVSRRGALATPEAVGELMLALGRDGAG